MSKIGILTYHHVANWGSVLQAYCLQQFLKKLAPKSEVEIIEYIPQTSYNYSQERFYSKSKKKKFFWQKQPVNESYLNKYNLCKNFLKKHCQLSEKSLVSDDLLEGKNFLLKQDYDAIFVGSDTVFQLGPNFGNKYIGAPQAPNLYFLPFTAPFKKIAFAVSVNPFEPSILESLDKEKTREALNDFEIIWYRDEVTKQALEMIGVSTEIMEFMPDPTLLTDFELLIDSTTDNYKQSNLAAVAIGNGKLAEEIITTLKSQGYTTINLLSGSTAGNLLKPTDISSVEDYIALHRTFDLVITDRFHSSIITLVVGKCPIIGIEEVQRYPQPNSKLRDLYKRLGIEFMVCRYQNQHLNLDWLKSYLDQWNFTKQDILIKLTQIRLNALSKTNIKI